MRWCRGRWAAQCPGGLLACQADARQGLHLAVLAGGVALLPAVLLPVLLLGMGGEGCGSLLPATGGGGCGCLLLEGR